MYCPIKMARQSSSQLNKQLYSKDARNFVAQVIDLQNAFRENDKCREPVDIESVSEILNSGCNAEAKKKASEAMDQINSSFRNFLISCMNSLQSTSLTGFYDLISLSRPVAARFFSNSNYNINIPFNVLWQLSYYLECSISYLYFKKELKTPFLKKYQLLLKHCDSLTPNRVRELADIVNKRNPDLGVEPDNDFVRRRISLRMQEYASDVAIPFVEMLKNCAVVPTLHILNNSIMNGLYTGRTTPFLATCLSLKISPDFFISPTYSFVSSFPKTFYINGNYSKVRLCDKELIDALTQHMDVNVCNQLIADIIAGKL